MAVTATSTIPAPARRPLRVDSEVGRLRRVILHRPGRELARLTAVNKNELLFDDVVSLRDAQREHDALARILCEWGVEVLLLEELLAETLADPGVRDHVLTASLGSVPPSWAAAVQELLTSAAPAQLARRLICGIAADELPGPASADITPGAFALPPLPNHLYARDASAWVYGGVTVHAMAKAARRREALHYEAIYRHHPVFAVPGAPMWSDATHRPRLEGGDVLVLGAGGLLIGVGERTELPAVHSFARRLFSAGAVKRVIAIEIPRRRASIHLDSLTTMVDWDAFVVHPPARHLPAFTLTPWRGRVRAEPEPDWTAAVARHLATAMRWIDTGGEGEAARREQWNHANNVLALEPGVVIGYEVNVLTVPGETLGRGRGGARCLSCPIERDPVASGI